MKWIIDTTMKNPLYGGSFYETLIKMGRHVDVHEHTATSGTYPMGLKETHIAYGSVEFVKNAVLIDKKVVAFAPTSQYDFSYFSSNIPPIVLLNQNSMIIPFGWLKTSTHRIEQTYGNRIFIRSNSGGKVLTGQVVDTYDIPIIEAIGRRCNPETMVVVSKEQKIAEEYRCFVSRKNGVLTGSTYHCIYRGDERRLTEEQDYDVMHFANMLMTGFSSDRFEDLLVIDIVRVSDGSLRLVEINCASCSGMYACDPEPVILEMERIIEKEQNME